MILEGNERGNGKKLAKHLLNMLDNDHVEVHEVSGFLSEDLTEALDEVDAIARGTKCKKYLFAVSLNPPEGEDAPIAYFEDAIAKIEAKMGLQGQPRAIVFHEKKGRRHAHVAWSRIHVETHKAINLPFYKMKLMDISRELYLKYDWEMPQGFKDRSLANPLNMSREEWQQAKRAMDDPRLLKQILQDAWAQSDNKASFEQALLEKGLFLAQGDRRDFLAVDVNGTPYSLSKFLSVKTKELKAKLGDPKELLTLEQVKQRIAEKLPAHLRDTIQQQKEQMALHVQKRTYTQAELIDIITHQHAAFNRRMMERSLYRCFNDPSTMRQAIADLITSGKLVDLGERNGQAFYTTKDMQQLEQKLVDMADGMASKQSNGMKHECRQEAVTAFNQQLA